MRSLLLIACSARKRVNPPEPIRALDRYDGVFFRVLRKWIRNAPRSFPEVLIISAKFGLIGSDALIPSYDYRMTAGRARELMKGIRSSLSQHLAQNSYTRIFVNLGKNYRSTVDGIPALEQATWANGPIGLRARQTKEWLELLSAETHRENP